MAEANPTSSEETASCKTAASHFWLPRLGPGLVRPRYFKVRYGYCTSSLLCTLWVYLSWLTFWLYPLSYFNIPSSGTANSSLHAGSGPMAGFPLGSANQPGPFHRSPHGARLAARIRFDVCRAGGRGVWCRQSIVQPLTVPRLCYFIFEFMQRASHRRSRQVFPQDCSSDSHL